MSFFSQLKQRAQIIDPFIKNSEHDIFLLCKASNSGAADLQDQILVDGLIYRGPGLMREILPREITIKA